MPRICAVCQLPFPTTAFYRTGRGRDKTCKKCRMGNQVDNDDTPRLVALRDMAEERRLEMERKAAERAIPPLIEQSPVPLTGLVRGSYVDYHISTGVTLERVRSVGDKLVVIRDALMFDRCTGLLIGKDGPRPYITARPDVPPYVYREPVEKVKKVAKKSVATIPNQAAVPVVDDASKPDSNAILANLVNWSIKEEPVIPVRIVQPVPMGAPSTSNSNAILATLAASVVHTNSH